MVSLKQTALDFEPKSQVKNIADLSEVNVELDLQNRTGKNKDTGEEFTYKCIVINNEEYRVPGKVIGDLKVILEENPNLKKFKVRKTGEGMNTKYTVIPLG